MDPHSILTTGKPYLLLAAVLLSPSGVLGSQTIPAPACSIRLISVEPITVDNGRIVLRISDAVHLNKRWVVLGTDIMRSIDTRGAAPPPSASPQPSDLGAFVPETRSIGVESIDGKTSFISNPLSRGELMHARVIPAASGGWHVLLIARLGPGPVERSQTARAQVPDSAALWFGRYERGRWTQLVHLGTVTDAWLSRGAMSELTGSGNIAFAFASGFPFPKRITVARFEGRRWSFDTLVPPRVGALVRIAAVDSTWVVGHGDLEFVVHRLDNGRWTHGRPIAKSGNISFINLGLASASGHLTAWWATEGQSAASVVAARLDPKSLSPRASVVLQDAPLDEFATNGGTAAADGVAVWAFARNSGHSMAIIAWKPSRDPAIRLLNVLPGHSGVLRSGPGDQIIHISDGLGGSRNVRSSTISKLRVSCGHGSEK